MDYPKAQDPTTAVPDKNKASSLEGVHSKTIGVIWNIKHKISSPESYELLIKKKLKGGTALDFKNFYKHIKM